MCRRPRHLVRYKMIPARVIGPVRARSVAVAAHLICLQALLPAGAEASHIPFTRTPVDPATVPAVGKLETVGADQEPFSCSGVVVDANNQSVVVTAAHCIYRAGGLPETARFLPAYNEGVAPFGDWEVMQYLPSDPWVASGHSHFDWAFLVLDRNSNGQAIEDVVGGLPIEFNQPRTQAYKLLGYPAEPSPPFDGERLWACETAWGGNFRDPDPDEQYGPLGMVVGCDMGHGASGGPWLNAAGVVSSVISTQFGGHPNILGGPYFGDDAAAKFAVATGTPETAACKGRAVTHLGTQGADAIRGTNGDDVIVLGSGKDSAKGGPGSDTICGNGGKDTIKGGPGRDKCVGGPGRDRLRQCP